jgi:hypothetical protein
MIHSLGGSFIPAIKAAQSNNTMWSKIVREKFFAGFFKAGLHIHPD